MTEALSRASGPVITPSGRTIRPRSPTGWAGSTARSTCGTGSTSSGLWPRACGGRDRRVLLVGMGGSSLYPEVLARSPTPADGMPLTCWTRTHPAAVAACPRGLRPPDAARGRVQVRHDDRDPQPPRAVLGRPRGGARRGCRCARRRDHGPGSRVVAGRGGRVPGGGGERSGHRRTLLGPVGVRARSGGAARYRRARPPGAGAGHADGLPVRGRASTRPHGWGRCSAPGRRTGTTH